MKTVGNLIKETRLGKNISKEELGEMTHIKVAFISDIENGQWEKLPNFSTTLGFVKSISHFLDIDELTAVSLFRREYPPTLKSSGGQAHQNKRPEIARRFIWGPRFTFLTLILIIILGVAGYLGFQYRKFNLPPSLTIDEPKENQTVGSLVDVKGKTDPDATLVINNQSVIVSEDGGFSAQINIDKNETEITIEAKSRSGKETLIKRKILFQP